MKIRRILSIFCAIFTAFFALHVIAVSPEFEIWSDGTNYRYLIKDWHRDYLDGRVSIQQQEDILWAATQKKSEAFILVEDSSTYTRSVKTVQEIYTRKKAVDIKSCIREIQKINKINLVQAIDSSAISEMSPIHYLINECEKAQLKNYNVECAHAIHTYKQQNIELNLKVTQEDVINDLNEHLQNNMDNAAPLYTILQQKIESLKKIHDDLIFLTEAYKARFILVDTAIIDKLTKWNAIKHGFVFAGSMHIENTKYSLAILGYKFIKSVGNANIWPLGSSAANCTSDTLEKINDEILRAALDLKKEFRNIFAEQEKQEAENLKTNSLLYAPSQERIKYYESLPNKLHLLAEVSATYGKMKPTKLCQTSSAPY